MDAQARRLRNLVALPLLVVALVAGGSTGLAGLQLTGAPEPAATGPQRPDQQVLGEAAAPDVLPTAPPAADLYAWTDEIPTGPELRALAPDPTATPKPAAPIAETQPAKPTASTTVTRQATRYTGRNHFWMPALGINRKVYDYPCPRKRPPDHYVYRWWCAGQNNVYLLGHASSVMKPLHDAYVRGQLRVGMVAYYANDAGKVRKYRITEWRVVRPEESHWAIADQPVPSMTLQTCVGKDDEFRLNVRLVAVN